MSAGELSLLTIADLRPEWHERAACRGQGNTAWFQDHQAHDAKRICARCPAVIDCLEASVSAENNGVEHNGIWGGAGGQQRRLLRRLHLKRPHDDPGPVRGCGCGWCAEVNRHLARISSHRNPNAKASSTGVAVPNRNTGGARHALRSTHAKGCRCVPCRWSASKSAQALARSGVDTSEWWFERFGGWNMDDKAAAAAARLVAGVEALVAAGELRPHCELQKSARELAAVLGPVSDDTVDCIRTHAETSGDLGVMNDGTSDPPEFVPTGWIATRWDVDPRTVRNLIHDGSLPSFQISPGVRRVRRSDVERYEQRAQEDAA